MNYDKLIQHYMEEALGSLLGKAANVASGAARIGTKVASSAANLGVKVGANALQNQNKTVFDTLSKSSNLDPEKLPSEDSLKIGKVIIVPYTDPSRDARGRILRNPQSFVVGLRIKTEIKNGKFQAEIIDKRNFYSRSVNISGVPYSKIERLAVTAPTVPPTFIVDVGTGTLYEIYKLQ